MRRNLGRGALRKLLVLRRRGRVKMKSRSVLQLQYEEGRTVVREYPVRDLDAVLVLGKGLYIESSAVSVLSSMNVPMAVVAGDSVGVLLNPVIVASPNYRRLQYTVDRVRAIEIALEYIKSKVGGMINVLRYHGAEAPAVPAPPAPAGDAEVFEQEVRSWESQASSVLWDRLVLLLRPQVLSELRARYGFLGRRPRRPDPFNKTLSVMYAILYALGTRALLAAGLDPTYGLLHRTRYSTPLTFDYVEMFKPVAVEATIGMLNSGGLPELDEDGELVREHVNQAVKALYEYLTLEHKDTRRSIYRQIYLKAFCLASYLEGKCRKEWLTVTWDRSQYRRPRTKA